MLRMIWASRGMLLRNSKCKVTAFTSQITQQLEFCISSGGCCQSSIKAAAKSDVHQLNFQHKSTNTYFILCRVKKKKKKL